MKKSELTKQEKERAEIRKNFMEETPMVPGWDKLEEEQVVVQLQEQPKQIKAVNPINPNFVFPEYDSRDARSRYQHQLDSMEYAIEQEKLRKARCCCGSCKCGR